MGGKPFTNLSDALSFIESAKNQPADIKDLYFCLSLQAKTGPTRKGNPTALRRAANAVALKAIWLDIDCNKEPPNGYRCKEDGLNALIQFCDATRTPYPTAIVGKRFPFLLDFRQTAIREGVASLRSGIGCTGRTARITSRFHHRRYCSRPPGPWNVKQQAGPTEAGGD
jgi:hypothetical protein